MVKIQVDELIENLLRDIVALLKHFKRLKKKELYFLLYILYKDVLFFEIRKNDIIYNNIIVRILKEMIDKGIIQLKGNMLTLAENTPTETNLDKELLKNLEVLLEKFRKTPEAVISKISKRDVLIRKHKGLSPLIAAIILLLITVSLGVTIIYFYKGSFSEDIQKITSKKNSFYSELSNTNRVEIVEFSQDIKADILKKFLEQQGFLTTIVTFDSYYNNFMNGGDNNKNIIFLGNPTEDVEIKLLNLINKYKSDNYKIVFLFDDKTSLPNSLLNLMGVEKFRYLSVDTLAGIEEYDFLIPSPIVHVLKTVAFKDIPQQYYIERVTSNSKEAPYLYLSETGNLIGMREPSGMVTLNEIKSKEVFSETISDSKFYYTTFQGVSQPILIITFGDPSDSPYFYVMCEDRSGIAGDFIKVKKGQYLSCEYLKNWEIDYSTDRNYLVLKDPNGEYYKVPWIIYDNLDVSGTTTITIDSPIIINNIVYPLLSYTSSSGVKKYIFDFLKTGSGYIFDKYENIDSSVEFTLPSTPFKFGLESSRCVMLAGGGVVETNCIILKVKGFSKDYSLVSIASSNIGFSKVYLIYSEIFYDNSPNNIILKDIFSQS